MHLRCLGGRLVTQSHSHVCLMAWITLPMIYELVFGIAGVNLQRLPSLKLLDMSRHCFRGSLNCQSLTSLMVSCDPSICMHTDRHKTAALMFANLIGLRKIHLQLIRPTLQVSSLWPPLYPRFCIFALQSRLCYQKRPDFYHVIALDLISIDLHTYSPTVQRCTLYTLWVLSVHIFRGSAQLINV